MAVVALCRDDPAVDTAALRATALQQHFAYIESVLDRLLVAGPIRDASGKQIASLLIYDVDEIDAARQLLENDPYYRAGIYSDIEFSPFLPAAGRWIGGKIW